MRRFADQWRNRTLCRSIMRTTENAAHLVRYISGFHSESKRQV